MSSLFFLDQWKTITMKIMTETDFKPGMLMKFVGLPEYIFLCIEEKNRCYWRLPNLSRCADSSIITFFWRRKKRCQSTGGGGGSSSSTDKNPPREGDGTNKVKIPKNLQTQKILKSQKVHYSPKKTQINTQRHRDF